MSGTIENTNNNIILKFKYIIYLLNVIVDYKYNKNKFNDFLKKYDNITNKNDIFFTDSMNLNAKNKDKLIVINDILYGYSNNIDIKKYYITELKNIINSALELKYEYELGSSNILSNYFKNNDITDNIADNIADNLIKKKNFFNVYHNFITNENFISKINRLILDLVKFINLNKFEYRVLKITDHILYLFNNNTVQNTIHEIHYDICECKNNMIIDSQLSVMVCEKCGMINEMTGTVFEDDQFYYQEGQRSKHGTYDPSKHCKFWVERIQARENTEIPNDIIAMIKLYIKRDKIQNKNHITCTLIRKYLRQSHNSKYNEHVPLIRKLITGLLPPQLTEYELQLINLYFDKVIFIFENIKPENKTNCPYHPYFIYKIIEQIIKKDSDRIRKLQILSCIHLQSRETLICNDTLWKEICKKIKEFEYIPTDRNN
jgi:hypothetical protein